MPNLVGRPFSLDPGFASELGVDDPAQLVVELLARQLASPVRWIETQHALVEALGVRRFVEVGPAHADVLTGLARITLADSGTRAAARGTRSRRRARSRRSGASGGVRPGGGAHRGGHVRSPGCLRSYGLQDRPVDAGDALAFVLALQARVRIDQLDPSETLDELFQGVSSRRNQVLIDLGREFGLSGAEGVQRHSIGELVKSLREQGASYRFPGAYLREALAAGLTRAGLARPDAAARLAATWGLGPGLTEHVLARVALDTRPGPVRARRRARATGVPGTACSTAPSS